MTPSKADSGWHPRRLLDAPHRLGFAAGGLMLAATALWWACRLLGLQFGPDAVPAPVAHALALTWGFMPLFMAGFLFTAGPRWLQRPAVSARELLPAIGAQLAGWLVLALALTGGGRQGPLLAGMGLALVAAGWNHLVLRFWRLLRASTVEDRLHARVALAACMLLALLLHATVAALVAQAWTYSLALARVALWGGIGVVYAAVLHRMIPFFGNAAPRLDARWPSWLLWAMAGVLAAQGLVEGATMLAAAPWPPLAQALRAAGQGAAGLGVLALAWRWSQMQSLRQRLLAMLHRGFAWLGVALLLAAASQPAAALHAYALGFLGSLLLAMAARVVCGHSGRAVVADGPLWALFQALQFAVLARVGAALWPALSPWLLPLAAAAWAAVALGWGLRYGRPSLA
ncbi:NnrS family protein [Azohydromonas aeria]|uniref:NnrS family protein n=1 Tax=Azohydromonas aeria TaxID=2590212 RepID=UPI0012FB9311|nr:NnrS family protein [Azohydromonas aeria]